MPGGDCGFAACWAADRNLHLQRRDRQNRKAFDLIGAFSSSLAAANQAPGLTKVLKTQPLLPL